MKRSLFCKHSTRHFDDSFSMRNSLFLTAWETVVSQESFIIDVSGSRFCIVLVSEFRMWLSIILSNEWHYLHFISFHETAESGLYLFASPSLQLLFLHLGTRRSLFSICFFISSFESLLRTFSAWWLQCFIRKQALEREFERRKRSNAVWPEICCHVLHRHLPVFRSHSI